jgi:hypothetical protein
MLELMAKKVPLGRGLFAIVDDEDYLIISRFRWHSVRGNKDSSDLIYAVANIRMHRLILDVPIGMFVDHINGDPLDNRRCNLRLCTNAQNQQNTHSRGGSSRYKGVSYSKRKKRWKGAFIFEGRYYYCGSWGTEREAAAAVDKKRREICGDFASKNLLDQD